MKVELTLETITPLFLGGADQQPELRPASVRGALRFWLRAMFGGVIGDGDIDRLHQLEANVFGKTEVGSPIVIRILDHPPASNVQELNQPGCGYLWFSMKKRNAPNRQAISAATRWRAILQMRRGEDAIVNRAVEALWLLSQLGSLGARSRRGAGSLQIRQVAGWPVAVPSPVVQATTPTALHTELEAGLRQIRANLTEWISPPPLSALRESEFDLLHPDVCGVWVLDQLFDRWRDALEALGLAMQSFRVRFPRSDYPGVPDDYANVKSALQGNNLAEPVQRAAFGLPIVFYFSSLGGQRGTLEGDEHDRRSSPLIIRVTQLANGKFVVVLIVFYAKLLPDGERLKLRRQGPPARANTPDWTALNLFLTHIDSTVGPRLEVNYQ